MKHADAIAEIRSINRTCRGQHLPGREDLKNSLLTEGRHEEAAIADTNGRMPCGTDINDLICAEPFDGGAHKVACPNCGLLIQFTSPVYEIEES